MVLTNYIPHTKNLLSFSPLSLYLSICEIFCTYLFLSFLFLSILLIMFLKWQPCHFSVMAICFVYVNLPTVLLMSFNKLSSCPVTNFNLLLSFYCGRPSFGYITRNRLNIPLKTAISCNVIIAWFFSSFSFHIFLSFLTYSYLSVPFLSYIFSFFIFLQASLHVTD